MAYSITGLSKTDKKRIAEVLEAGGRRVHIPERAASETGDVADFYKANGVEYLVVPPEVARGTHSTPASKVARSLGIALVSKDDVFLPLREREMRVMRNKGRERAAYLHELDRMLRNEKMENSISLKDAADIPRDDRVYLKRQASAGVVGPAAWEVFEKEAIVGYANQMRRSGKAPSAFASPASRRQYDADNRRQLLDIPDGNVGRHRMTSELRQWLSGGPSTSPRRQAGPVRPILAVMPANPPYEMSQRDAWLSGLLFVLHPEAGFWFNSLGSLIRDETSLEGYEHREEVYEGRPARRFSGRHMLYPLYWDG